MRVDRVVLLAATVAMMSGCHLFAKLNPDCHTPQEYQHALSAAPCERGAPAPRSSRSTSRARPAPLPIRSHQRSHATDRRRDFELERVADVCDGCHRVHRFHRLLRHVEQHEGEDRNKMHHGGPLLSEALLPALPQMVAVGRAQRQPVQLLKLFDFLQRLRRERSLPLKRMQNNAL